MNDLFTDTKHRIAFFKAEYVAHCRLHNDIVLYLINKEIKISIGVFDDSIKLFEEITKFIKEPSTVKEPSNSFISSSDGRISFILEDYTSHRIIDKSIYLKLKIFTCEITINFDNINDCKNASREICYLLKNYGKIIGDDTKI